MATTTAPRVDQAETTTAPRTATGPLAQVEADIAAAAERIRAARDADRIARRAASTPNRARADVSIEWFDPQAKAWKKAFTAKLSVPFPTVRALDALLTNLLGIFKNVSSRVEVRAAAAIDPDSRPGERALFAYTTIGPDDRQA